MAVPCRRKHLSSLTWMIQVYLFANTIFMVGELKARQLDGSIQPQPLPAVAINNGPGTAPIQGVAVSGGSSDPAIPAVGLPVDPNTGSAVAGSLPGFMSTTTSNTGGLPAPVQAPDIAQTAPNPIGVAGSVPPSVVQAPNGQVVGAVAGGVAIPNVQVPGGAQTFPNVISSDQGVPNVPILGGDNSAGSAIGSAAGAAGPAAGQVVTNMAGSGAGQVLANAAGSAAGQAVTNVAGNAAVASSIDQVKQLNPLDRGGQGIEVCASLDDFIFAVDSSINDTMKIVSNFPTVVGGVLTGMNAKVASAVQEPAYNIQPAEVANALGNSDSQSALDSSLKVVVPVLTDLKAFTSGTPVERDNLLDRATRIRDDLANIRDLSQGLNSIQSSSGVTFQRSTPLDFDPSFVDAYQQVVDKLQNAATWASLTELYNSAGFADLDAYIADSKAIIDRLKDITGAINQASRQNAAMSGQAVSTAFSLATSSIQMEATTSSSNLTLTLQGASSSVKDMFKPGTIGEVIKSKLYLAFFAVFVFGVSTAGLVLLFIFFSIAVTVCVVVFLILAAFLLLITMVVSDVCGLAQDSANIPPQYSTLWGTAYGYIPRLFYYRQQSCFNTDVGLVRFGYQMGAFPDNVGNLTKALTPTIMGLNPEPNIERDFWIVNSAIGVDKISQPLQYFLNGDAILSWKAFFDTNVDAVTTKVAALQSTTASEVSRVNSNQGSSAAPDGFTVTSGSLTYQILQSSQYFTDLQNAATRSSDLSPRLSSFVTDLSNFVNGIKKVAAKEQDAQYPKIPDTYNDMTSKLSTFVSLKTSQRFQQSQDEMRQRILVAVDQSRQDLDRQLPCGKLANNTKAFENALCSSFLYVKHL
ncbi:hypothetical protein HDU96_002096 [Phlyctochytrium bullatum]|nr:hypothetical protein HDU96_002096 [Phlyctochytrium bullatum]